MDLLSSNTSKLITDSETSQTHTSHHLGNQDLEVPNNASFRRVNIMPQKIQAELIK